MYSIESNDNNYTVSVSGNTYVVEYANVVGGSISISGNHNILPGLQGGSANEYYHLSASQFADYIGGTEVAAISSGLYSFTAAASANALAQAIAYADTIEADLSAYALTSTVAAVSAGLDARIGNLEANPVPDIFATEVAAISAGLQAQIDGIPQPDFSAYALTVTVAAVSAGLDARLVTLESNPVPDIFASEVAAISADLQSQIDAISGSDINLIEGPGIQIIESPDDSFTISVTADYITSAEVANISGQLVRKYTFDDPLNENQEIYSGLNIRKPGANSIFIADHDTGNVILGKAINFTKDEGYGGINNADYYKLTPVSTGTLDSIFGSVDDVIYEDSVTSKLKYGYDQIMLDVDVAAISAGLNEYMINIVADGAINQLAVYSGEKTLAGTPEITYDGVNLILTSSSVLIPQTNDYNYNIGNNVTTNATSSTVYGFNNDVHGIESLVIGNGNTLAVSDNNIQVGCNNILNSSNDTIVIGTANDLDSSSNKIIFGNNVYLGSDSDPKVIFGGSGQEFIEFNVNTADGYRNLLDTVPRVEVAEISAGLQTQIINNYDELDDKITDAITPGRGLASSDAGGLQLQSSRNYLRIFTDFHITSGTFFSSNSGTGAAVSEVTIPIVGRYGIAELSTGTTSTGRSAHHDGGQQWFIDGTDLHILEMDIMIPTLSDGTDTFKARFGGYTTLSAPPGGQAINFSYTDSEDSGNFRCECRQSSTSTTVDSGVAVVAGTWYRLRIEGHVDGSTPTVRFYINGTLVATITTNVCDSPSQSTRGFSVGIYKSAGTNARSIQIDYVDISRPMTGR